MVLPRKHDLGKQESQINLGMLVKFNLAKYNLIAKINLI